jgi:uncharacterized protein YpuA (DUF1002 family)
MTDIDWSNPDEIEEFRTQMKELGYNIPESEMNALIGQMQKAGNAAKELDFTKATEQIRNL